MGTLLRKCDTLAKEVELALAKDSLER
jgi:hypothetical protein